MSIGFLLVKVLFSVVISFLVLVVCKFLRLKFCVMCVIFSWVKLIERYCVLLCSFCSVLIYLKQLLLKCSSMVGICRWVSVFSLLQDIEKELLLNRLMGCMLGCVSQVLIIVGIVQFSLLKVCGIISCELLLGRCRQCVMCGVGVLVLEIMIVCGGSWWFNLWIMCWGLSGSVLLCRFVWVCFQN